MNAFCDAYREEKQAYIAKYNDREAEANQRESTEAFLISMVSGFESMGDVVRIFDRLAQVAPEEIAYDVETVRDTLRDQLNSMPELASDPLGTVFGTVLRALTTNGPGLRVEQYIVDHCLEDGASDFVPRPVEDENGGGTAVSATELPFAVCHDDGTADVRALDPETDKSRLIMSDVASLCNLNRALGDAHLTSSGRYIAVFWDPMFGEEKIHLIDLVGRVQRTWTLSELEQWKPYLSEGLNAERRPPLSIGGFDSRGDGTLFVYTGRPFDDQFLDSTGPKVFAQSLPSLLRRDAAFKPDSVPSTYCTESRRWSRDGDLCLLVTPGSSYPQIIQAGVGPDEANDLPTSSQLRDAEMRDCGGLEWVTDRAVIQYKNKGIWLCPVDGEYGQIVELTGDRRLTPWTNPRSQRLFFLSPTLDGSTTQIYEVRPTLAAEPVLIASTSVAIEPIAN